MSADPITDDTVPEPTPSQTALTLIVKAFVDHLTTYPELLVPLFEAALREDTIREQLESIAHIEAESYVDAGDFATCGWVNENSINADQCEELIRDNVTSWDEDDIARIALEAVADKLTRSR